MDLNLCANEDIPRIVELCSHFQEASNYHIQFDEDYVTKQVSDLLLKENSLILGLYDKQNLLEGILIAVAVTHPFFNIPFASELIWWIEPEYRGSKQGLEMIKAYEYWAVNKMGCKMVHMVSLADDVDKLYDKLGYTKQEHNWSKTWPH